MQLLMIAHQRLGPLQPVHCHNLAMSSHIPWTAHQLISWHTCVAFTFTLTCTGSHDTMTTSYIYHQTIIHTTHSTYCPSRLCQWPCSCRRRGAVSCRPCPPSCTRAGRVRWSRSQHGAGCCSDAWSAQDDFI